MVTRNDLDINSFQKSLKAQKKKVEQNIETVKAELNVLAAEDEIDDDGDMAELEIENTTNQKILHHLEDELDEIDYALSRIQKGTYGICEKTGQKIPLERLKVNPMARTVVDG